MIRPHTNPFITGISASSSSDGISPSNNNSNNSSPSSPPSNNTSDSDNSDNNSYFNSYRGSYYSDDNNNRNSSDGDNSNDSTQRHAVELPRPDEAHLPAPSGKTPAYTPRAPLTAQARARARLGHTGSTSTLRSATFPLARGSTCSTAGTGIRPPGYSLNDVHNNRNNNSTHDVAAGAYEPAEAAVVPPVASPPPYVSHLQDRFLETDQAATWDANSPQCPPPAYGVAPPISFLGNSAARDTTTRPPSIASYRTARSLRSLRGARSINTVDDMIDLERGNPPQNKPSEYESGKVGFITTTFVVLVVVLCGVWWFDV
ncbi:hypothetical protein QBC45DRAFT_489045 [Copromyces sp. CBS 386.78]|nr:hypothetical protein QBC45DRAFT_489045 [Copromyces sp. CBS 386.78]